MEHMELIPRSGFRLIQDDLHFRLGSDSVMLAAFAKYKKNARVCDLGCGTGALSLLALGYEPSLTIDGLDILPSALELFAKNMALNGLEGRIQGHLGDIAADKLPLEAGRYDLVISNPPYFSGSQGAVPKSQAIASARHGQGCTPEQLCRTAGRLLKNGGSFCLVYRCQALPRLMVSMTEAGLEPKRLRFIQHRADTAPKVFLLEARKGGKPGMETEAPLILKNNDGSDTSEAHAIYQGKER